MLALAGLMAVAGCGTSTEHEIAPWFKARTTKSANWGGLGGSVSTTEYFVRNYGFWWKLDDVGVGSARPVGESTKFFYASGAGRLVGRGDFHSRQACAAPRAATTLPPGIEAIDCYEFVAGPAAGYPTQVRWRRVDPGGHVLAEQVAAVEAAGRVFMGPVARYYDERGAPHFVALPENYTANAFCSLIRADGHAQAVVAEAALPARDCSEPAVWSRLAGYRVIPAR